MPAQSKAQQRFMGMVHAVQKGDMEAPSKEVDKAADSMSKKDAKDYASTSHKGLPNKKENMKITKERLKELVKEVMTEESEYQAFFQKALDKAGKGINDMNDDEKKAFFNKIDTAWNGKGEKNEALTGGQKELDVDKDGDIEGDDLADLRAGKTNEQYTWKQIDRTCALISNFAQVEKRDTKRFIEDNNLDMEKIYKDVSTSTPVGRMLFNKVVNDTPNSQIQKNYIRRFALKSGKLSEVENESVKEDISTELPKATIPSAVKQKLAMAIDKIKDAKLNNIQKLQLVAQVVDSLGIDKTQLGTITNKIRSKMESIQNEAELPAATLPGAIKSKLVMAIDKIKDSNLNFNQKVQVIGKVMDGLGIDKSEFNKMTSRLKGSIETPIKQESSIKEESPCWKGYQQIGMKDKGGKQVPNCVPEGKVNEAASPKDMDKIKSAVEAASSFMGVGSELKKLGMKYTFATEPLAIYIVQPTPNNKVAIVNKRYASKPDFVVGDIAVGIMEGIKYTKK
jgi:hypothetical protein